MIVFKTVLKILNRCKMPIFIYTIFLVFFGGFNMKTQDDALGFNASKPDVFIVNEDIDKGITKDFILYMNEVSHIVSLKKEEVDDALFYRDVNYVIYIPKDFGKDFMLGKNPQLLVKSTGDYQASLASMQVEKYMRLANLYLDINKNEDALLALVHENLEQQADIVLATTLDTSSLDKATFYYNFTNYCILAGCIYVICLVLSSFRKDVILKRTSVSGMNIKKHSWYLMISNSVFSLFLWFIYVLLSFLLIGKAMFSFHGLIYILNSLLFTFCALSIAFFISSLVRNKEAVNGIVNVIALGSSFLCGAFVPAEFLPKFVINIAHILPSYWFIQTNEIVKSLEVINFSTLKPILINSLVLFLFSLLFIGLSLKKNRRV